MIEAHSEFTSPKILQERELLHRIAELKKQGKKIGLCVGGYDLLHPGHMLHFASAKKMCDVLVVGVTADRFVSKRKQDGRPVYSEKLRAYSVAALDSVDYAIISQYERATELIHSLRPDFYIKGPDFIKKTTPGITAEREAIHACGGEMKYTTDEKLSTTDIIRYIKEHIKDERVLVLVDRDGTIIEEKHFLGKNEHWQEEVELRKDTIDLLIYLQTKHPTTMMVISNQSGVAMKHYDEQRVREVNAHINELLIQKGIRIKAWKYCPNVDASFAKESTHRDFDTQYVHEESGRKPATDMVEEGLRELGMKRGDFSKIIMIGDKEKEDGGLAHNLGAVFVNCKDKTYEQMKKIVENT